MKCLECGKEMEEPAPKHIRFAGWNWKPKELEILRAKTECGDCLFREIDVKTDSEIKRFKDAVARGEKVLLDEVGLLDNLKESGRPEPKKGKCKLCEEEIYIGELCRRHYNQDYYHRIRKEKTWVKRVRKSKKRWSASKKKLKIKPLVLSEEPKEEKVHRKIIPINAAFDLFRETFGNCTLTIREKDFIIEFEDTKVKR